MDATQPWFRQANGSAPARVGVIAEIGVNHDGDPTRANALIEAAALAGADAVKFQLFNPDRLLSAQSRLAAYQQGKADDARALLRALALSPEQMARLSESARRAGLRFIVTPFSLEDIPVLGGLNVDAVKIASPDAVNTPLLEAVAALGKPMLVSTGTCGLNELEPTAKLLNSHTPSGGSGGGGNSRGNSGGANCLLQCISSYPTPTDQAALGGIRALRDRFGLPTGYSDHTQDIVTGALAVAAGAVLIEKHLTYDRDARGPDHAASAEPAQFTEYVRLIRQAQTMLGPTAKRVLDIEKDVRVVSRQSVCALRDLPAGHRLTRADLTVKRPGTGIPAAELKAVIGQTLTRPIKADSLLTYDDLAPVHAHSAA